MKVIIDRKGNWYYHKKGDFHSLYGIIKEKDLKNGIIKSNIGKEFIVFDADFSDLFNKIKRGPAIILEKDVGYIIAKTGINPESKILDAGAGCGVLSARLARISKNVTAYENNKEFLEIAKNNFEFLDVKVKLKEKDIYEGIEEKDLDLITLDLLEPWKVIPHAKVLKSGGYLVVYVPSITQVSKFVESLDKDFILEEVIELVKRDWYVEGLKVRPKSRMIGHTGFLVFARKI